MTTDLQVSELLLSRGVLVLGHFPPDGCDIDTRLMIMGTSGGSPACLD